GVFGAFQIAGSVGFLIGPAFGGTLVSVLRDRSGAVQYDRIFLLVGALEVTLALISAVVLRRLLQQRALLPRPTGDAALAASVPRA
ncbi:MAG TPA: hypothetical protein VE861_03375, partial [Gemmatimonadaceae bacterium]|nr:hypothetical protein [Gemmatimonadaceae bacterium]